MTTNTHPDEEFAADAVDIDFTHDAEEVVEDALTAASERIAALEAEVRDLKTNYLRALADVENTKRLADKRIDDNRLYAVSNFAKELLTVADNMGRALLAAPADVRAKNETVATLAIGIEMTEKELLSALGKYAVRKVDSLGRAFDPHVHQAVQEVDKNDVPTGTVVQVYQDGYLINDRLLRPAMVVVSRGGPKRAAGDETAANGATPGSFDQSA